MSSPGKGLWVRVLLGGVPVAERVVPHGGALTIGEANDADLVVPGVGARQTLISRGKLRSVPGLAIRGGDGPDEVRGCIQAHPGVELQICRQTWPRPPGLDWRAHMPWRELMYGASLAGCLLGLLAVEQPAAAVEARGADVPLDSPVARFVYSGPGVDATPARPSVAAATPSGPRTPAAAPEVEAAVEVEVPAPVVAPDPEPAAVAPGPESPAAHRRSAANAPPSLRLRTEPEPALPPAGSPDAGEKPGRHSHPAAGLEDPAGVAGGQAAVADTLCPDPEVRPKSQVDDVELVRGGAAFASVQELQTAFRRWARFASGNQQLHASGANVDWPENTLDALHTAATGFDWRPAEDTLRLVVHASDDGFGEPGDLLSGLPVTHGYDETVRTLQEAQIRVASFGARIGGACECEDVRSGIMTRYRGRRSIPAATGGAAFDIDDVASRKLRFADAIGPLAQRAVCETHDVPWR